jgi:hypothetical protein
MGCEFITTLPEAGEIHAATATVNVYVPAVRPEIVELIPVPVVMTPPGDLVNVQVPVAGNPFRTALPVATEHVGCVILPTTGAVGISVTLRVYVAVAAMHGDPSGLLVVTVIVTVLFASEATGV